VGELDGDFLALAVGEGDVLAQSVDVRVEPEAGVFGRDAPVGLHRSCFDYGQAWLLTVVMGGGYRLAEILIASDRGGSGICGPVVKDGKDIEGHTPRWIMPPR
jgi:hypothetical protein